MEYDDIIGKLHEEVSNFYRHYNIKPNAVVMNRDVKMLIARSVEIRSNCLGPFQTVMGLRIYDTIDPTVLYRVALILEDSKE